MMHNAYLRETLRSADPERRGVVKHALNTLQLHTDFDDRGSLTMATALFYEAKGEHTPTSPPAWMAQALALPTVAARCATLLLPWRASCALLLPRSLPAEDPLIEARVQELCNASTFRVRIEANAGALRNDAVRVQPFLSSDPIAATFSAWSSLASWELARHLPPPSFLFPEVGRATAVLLSSICDEGGLR